MTNNADAPGAQDKKRKFTSVKMDWLDRLLSQVDGNTFKVGFAISKHLNERTGECFPSIERIAAVTGLSRSAVNRAIDKLREGGWINSHRTRGPSVYSIRDVSPAAHLEVARCVTSGTSDVPPAALLDVPPAAHRTLSIEHSNLTHASPSLRSGENAPAENRDLFVQDGTSRKKEVAIGKEPKRRKKPKVPLPPDFVLDERRRLYALDKGVRPDRVADVFEAFQNHHLAVGNEWSDWDAAWRKWASNEVKFSARGRNGSAGGPTILEKAAKLLHFPPQREGDR